VSFFAVKKKLFLNYMSCPKIQYRALPRTENKQSKQALRHQYPTHNAIVSIQSKLYSVCLTSNANGSSNLFAYPIANLKTVQPQPEEM
jgi:hypothetical protein